MKMCIFFLFSFSTAFQKLQKIVTCFPEDKLSKIYPDLQNARPDFAELDVFLGQHILLTLEQNCNPKNYLDNFPTPKPNHE